ncbi:UDP-2,3-diacylglucosamine diphosphatase [Piscinibacter sp.]|jgi:UDP-2,3-diacylglucosamine hydrolase|uniref:UDP-2,3-diacylglucosamine diphosphatase n=1 Tax=Piscinibacter sp. TaxID=1903157 RepID=UPI002F428E67
MADVDSPALPTFPEIVAPESWRAIDFISDLHLADNTPRTFEAFALHLRRTDADAVFILGDLFEVWVGDDAAQHGFEARCAAVLADAAQRRVVAFMAGNRDFLVGPALLRACGVRALADPTVLVAFGARTLLSHGDALCLSDVNYQRFRAQVRSDSWQREFLSRPLVERRQLARDMRDASQRRKAQQAAGEWFDLDRGETLRWMQAAATPTLIHGHTHLPASEQLGPGFERHVLSDWDLEQAGPARRAEVLRWRRDGLVRMAPATAPH